jgi:hypothetical protein
MPLHPRPLASVLCGEYRRFERTANDLRPDRFWDAANVRVSRRNIASVQRCHKDERDVTIGKNIAAIRA